MTGELFSVSPWVAKRVENLFVLNERVAMLGRWRHGFFGMVPVGATNVGSIKINFDQVRPPLPAHTESPITDEHRLCVRMSAVVHRHRGRTRKQSILRHRRF